MAFRLTGVTPGFVNRARVLSLSAITDLSQPPAAAKAAAVGDSLHFSYDPRSEPRVLVRFSYGDKVVDAVSALVDSGSQHSCLPLSIAQQLDLPLEPSRTRAQGVSGSVGMQAIAVDAHRALMCEIGLLGTGGHSRPFPLDPRIPVEDASARHPHHDVTLGHYDFIASFRAVTFELSQSSAILKLIGGPRSNPLLNNARR